MSSCLNKLILHFSIMELTLILLIIGVPAVLCETDGFELAKCDVRGAVTLTPNATGHCTCKRLVTGQACDVCVPGAYGLSSRSKCGCRSCFCMGITSVCRSSSLYRDSIHDSFDISIAANSMREGPTSFKMLPKKFLGNQLRSHYGHLIYTLKYLSVASDRQEPQNHIADIQIGGANNIILSHFYKYSPQDYLSASTPFLNWSVELMEDRWLDPDCVESKNNFLRVLSNIDFIKIKLSHGAVNYAISEVWMDTAVNHLTGRELVSAVEECDCPIGYHGLSCEKCSPGYTRRPVRPFPGICELLTCNGHSNQWDPATGFCKNCAHHTTGEHCHLCEPGYYGDATREGCKLANCDCNSVGSESNQCIDGVCQCKLNVQGARCDSCRPSTFGLSADNIKGCNKCFCSGITDQCHERLLYFRPVGGIIDKVLCNSGLSTINFIPPNYYGNIVRSYSGYLRLRQRFEATSDQKFDDNTEIILGGNGIYLQLSNLPVLLPGNVLNYSIPLRESGWKVANDDSRDATRIDFMEVLLHLEEISISAPRVEGITTVCIEDISIDEAVEDYSPGLNTTTQIEICDCPQGYTGDLCDSCSDGFYRDDTNRSLSIFGACIICPCNDHETSCEMTETGGVMCYCRAGYTGEYCEQADTSYEDPKVSVTLRMEPEQQTVPRGATAKLTCIVEDAEPSVASRIHLTLLRSDGLPLPRDSTVSDYILTIPNVERDATGVYICRGLSRDGIQFSNIPVSSLVIVSPPEIVLSPSNQTVELSGAPSMVCEATGDQPIKIKWTAVGRDLLPNEQDDGEGVLNFHGIASVNVGKYLCNATNAAGSVLAVAQVLFGPEECN